MPIATSTAFPPADAPSASPSDSTPIPSTMPPGSTFDILPPALHALTTLLASPSLLQPPSDTGPNGTANGTSADVQVNDPATGAATAGGPPTDPSLRDLPDLIISAKQRVQNAKAVVARLPDVDRTISQQEAEIRRVEARIERLKDAWREVQEAAVQAVGDSGQDTAMTDRASEPTEIKAPDTDVKMDEG